ncbi:MAG: DUF1844 domain-containing protein [Planctomycetota bacterium]
MSEDPNEQPQKKIIIDEHWKSQVQAEKEELARKQAQKEEEASADEAAGPDVPLPPPSLEILASSLGIQAMMAMGLLADPEGGKPEVHLNQAKHYIDTIAMLEEKTEGNRTAEETAVFSNLLHELRMGFLAVQEVQAEG